MRKAHKTFRKYFIPHEENDHRPHLLRAPAVAFFCLLALIVESVFLFGASSVIPRSRLFGEILVNALVSGTNQARVTDGLQPLHENPLLDAAAQEKANDMVKNDYFAHTSPTGITPWYWFANVGYDFTAAGENLAVNFTDSQDVTNAWMNSPEHRANILDAGYTDIGMATAQGTFEGHSAVYVVELFGTPAPVAAAPAPSPIALAPAAEAAAPPAPSPATAPKTTEKTPAVPATVTTTAAAVAGASVVASATPAASPASATVPAALQAPAPAAVSALNPVQAAAADPRRAVDYVYFAIALLFAAALLVNIFVKVRIQHPQLIFGGMVVILVAGLLIVLNQHFGAAGVVVL